VSETTLGDYRPPAIICREHGWEPGTRIVGDEGHGPQVIEITALGEEQIIAKTISGPHGPYREHGSWTLGCRDWQVAP
jgi:hypothetical protein